MQTPFRVAGIGAGYFSQFHYEAWTRLQGATLVAAVDTDLEKARATGAPAFDRIDDALALSPDIVDIITPPPSHLALIEQILDARPKAIICQKPFCQSLEEASQATRMAEAAGVPLIVHENFRFQPWYRVIKRELDAGRIGDVHQITFRLRPGDGQGPDAYLDRQPYFQQMRRFLVHETAVHWIDTFRFLLGEPKTVFADLRQVNPVIAGEDAGYIIFAYPDGARAMFDGNRHLDHAAENTRCTMGEALVEGTKGTLSLQGDGSVHLRKFGTLDETEVLQATRGTGFGGDCVYHLQAHVIEALQKGRTFENTARDYLSVIATEEAIYSATEKGGWVAPERVA